MHLLLFLAEAHNAGFFRDFLTIATDPAHILAEASFEALTGIILYPIGKRIWKKAIKKHDAEAHGVHES